jgi:hypothetical protein
MAKAKSIIAVMSELENAVKKEIRHGHTREEIINKMTFKYSSHLGEYEVIDFVNEKIDNYGDFSFIQKIMRSKIVRESSGKDVYILDPLTRSVERVTDDRLRGVFDRGKDISELFYTCRFVYNPYRMAQLYKDKNDMWCYNCYMPPEWQLEHFYSNGKIPITKPDDLPALYKRFIMHLVDNDMESYKYIIKWLANAVQYRNYCILATIGEQGVGKGRLFDIMKIIFGDSNWCETGNRLISERFNGQLKNKRVIYLDEAAVKSQEQEERLKVLVNNSLEVEAKGKDAEHITNFASIYFSSNSMDAIRLEDKDRRFCIVNLTNAQLKHVWSPEDIDSLTDPENVKQFAYFLYHFPVDKKEMLNVFNSKRTDEVREEGLSGWQNWLVDEFAIDNAGKTIKLETVADAIEDVYGHKYRPSKTAFKKVEKIYPKKLHVFKPTIDGKQVWSIKFPDKETTSI